MTLNHAAVAHDIDDREDELDEIATLKRAFKHVAERLARKHSGIPEHRMGSLPGWRETVDWLGDWLDELFCERSRQLRADNEDDLFRGGERP